MTEPPTPRLPVLHERHTALGAKMADFGGWLMPIEYAAGGVLKEHAHVRDGVGVFDVSHLGKLSVAGAGAADFVNECLTNDLHRIGPGQAQYTLCCTPEGGVVDDLIAYLRSDRDVFLVPNAANCGAVAALLAAAAPPGVAVTDQHEEYGILAVQGPRSADLLGALGLPSGHAYMSWAGVPWRGTELVVCRTGYTGEHGYELVVPTAQTPQLWDALLEQGRPLDVAPAGLGARDTLRTEMGYPLHGQDLSEQISPVQARCGWAVGWGKEVFWGRDALLAERAEGPSRVLRGLDALDRGIPRAGMAVSSGGDPVGVVTSGTFSPTLRRGIGLGLLRAELAEGDEVDIDIRGRASRFRIVRPPFVDADPRR
jgi:glycine cleavage system T protein (aminomethyltransferase)